MTVQARVLLAKKEQTTYATVVTLQPVYSGDKSSPNYSFSTTTPAGSISLTITNKAAIDAFEFGKEYDVFFKEVVSGS